MATGLAAVGRARRRSVLPRASEEEDSEILPGPTRQWFLAPKRPSRQS